MFKIEVSKLSETRPIERLQALVISNDDKKLQTIFCIGDDKKKWYPESGYPNYCQEFGLEEWQAKDIEVAVQHQIDSYVFGRTEEGGFRSLMQTSKECKLVTEISWDNL